LPKYTLIPNDIKKQSGPDHLCLKARDLVHMTFAPPMYAAPPHVG
jgi:hypothetical protein